MAPSPAGAPAELVPQYLHREYIPALVGGNRKWGTSFGNQRGGYAGVPKPPLVAGREFAGREKQSSRRVMGYAQWGAFAEQATVRPELLWPIPEGWTSEQGAAFPVNFFTAYFA